jgi:hypothetical protein
MTEPTDIQLQLAERLVDQLVHHRGCQDARHDTAWADHTTSSCDANHVASTTSLQELSGRAVPDVLSEPNIQKHRTDWNEVLPPADRRQLYTGIPTDEHTQAPPAIDLDAGSVEPPAGETKVWFDVDSAGGLASSLAVAREGLV